MYIKVRLNDLEITHVPSSSTMEKITQKNKGLKRNFNWLFFAEHVMNILFRYFGLIIHIIKSLLWLSYW